MSDRIPRFPTLFHLSQRGGSFRASLDFPPLSVSLSYSPPLGIPRNRSRGATRSIDGKEISRSRSPGIGISSFPTLPSVSSPLSSHPLGCMRRKAVLVAPCVIGKREYRARYLNRLGTEEKGQLRPTGRNQVSSSSLLIRNPSINQRY